MGVEILTPGATTGASPAATTGAVPGGATAKPADNGGLKAVGPENATPLAPVEKPAAAPETVNDVASKPQPAAQTPNANGKNPKPEFDKSDESSSKHKKKKGLSKLNPF
jgi:outer membrane protein assembly factor BamD